MIKNNEKFFWTWKTILILAVGLVAANVVNNLREQRIKDGVNDGIKQVQQSVREMDIAKKREIEQLTDEVQQIVLSNLSPEEAKRALHLMNLQEEGGAQYVELQEWSSLLAKASQTMSPSEKEKFEHYKKMISDLAKDS